ncbi:hypothetical protein ACOJCM_09920 [Billgrantia sp. LNSP4103-1]|uniref:hypothetical protein n=1 Tax=Billgrantia sp. LNSP4103-1 TaxID=3410266 RepID=UPI00403F079C
MMTTYKEPTWDDVLSEFVATYEQPTAEALNSFIQRYPNFQEELIDFAATWAEQEMLPESEPLSEAEERLLVDRAMSHVQNVAFKHEQERDDSTANSTPMTSLADEAKKTGMKPMEFAKACQLDLPIFSKLSKRQIRPETIPGTLTSHIARLLGRPVGSVIEYFAASPQGMAGQAFLAREKPQATGQQTFTDAVRNSSLSEAEKARWLDQAADLEEE